MDETDKNDEELNDIFKNYIKTLEYTKNKEKLDTLSCAHEWLCMCIETSNDDIWDLFDYKEADEGTFRLLHTWKDEEI